MAAKKSSKKSVAVEKAMPEMVKVEVLTLEFDADIVDKAVKAYKKCGTAVHFISALAMSGAEKSALLNQVMIKAKGCVAKHNPFKEVEK